MNTEGLIGIVIIGSIWFLIKSKSAPQKAINDNEFRAYNNKEKLKVYLSNRIEEATVMADKKSHLKDPKEAEYYLNEIHTVKTVGILEFDDLYIKLKEKYKFDEKELVNISIDYCDWYLYQKEYFDPINNELWNESSYDDQKEAWIKICEIEKRLKKKIK